VLYQAKACYMQIDAKQRTRGEASFGRGRGHQMAEGHFKNLLTAVPHPVNYCSSPPDFSPSGYRVPVKSGDDGVARADID